MKIIIFYTLLLLPFSILAQTGSGFTLHFELNKYELTAAAKASLDSFILEEKALKSISAIQLHGHCDFSGSDDHNDQLSEQRVLAVKDYLVQHDVAESIFTLVQGHGKRAPLNNNVTTAERSLNRRVEISITRIIVPEAVINTEIVKDTVAAIIAVPQKDTLPEKKLAVLIADESIKKGSHLILSNINFEGSSHQLLPKSLPALTELLEVMRQNPKLKIEVQGHICCIPGDEDGYDAETLTKDLSEQRAKAIRQYLTKNGIEKNRITYKGLGHSKPIYSYPEKTEQEQALNRRVEIKIISK